MTTTTTNHPETMTVAAAAKALGEPVGDLRKAIAREEVPVIRDGRRVRVLSAWVADPARWRSQHLAASTPAETPEPPAAELVSLVERYDAGDTSVTIDQYDDAIETLDGDGSHMTTTPAPSPAPAPATGQLLGYARVSTTHQSLDQQTDALTAAGVEPARVYTDKLTGTSTKEQRPGLAALLDYARPGDTIVVAGIDRLGRNAAEVMLTIRDLGERGIVLRSLREGIDTSNATGRMIAGVLASLAELELELQRERVAAARAARKARGGNIGRPKKLTPDQIRQAHALRASGEPVPTIAATLGVAVPTMYRALRATG